MACRIANHNASSWVSFKEIRRMLGGCCWVVRYEKLVGILRLVQMVHNN